MTTVTVTVNTLEQNPLSETLAHEALLSLAGMDCSRCGKPLDTRNKKYSCCRTAHCPFCGKPDDARCVHRVAHRTYGRWCIPGVVGERANPPGSLLEPGLLLDYTDQQKRDAFGAGEPMLLDVYGPGFLGQKQPASLTTALIDRVMRPDSVQDVNSGGRYNRYCFSRDPQAARERAMEGLNDLKKGFDRLRKMTPAGAKYLLHTLTVPVTLAQTLRLLRFSPDGSLLLTALDRDTYLWDVETGKILHHLNLGEGVARSASFSPDGKVVAVSSEIGYRSWTQDTVDTAVVQVWDTETGTRLSRVTGIGGNALTTSSPSEAFLHGSRRLAVVRERSVRIVATGGDRKLIELPHRDIIRHAAFSDDGVTFATNQQHFVLLWRLLFCK